ncbi:hypothetical protein Xmau_02654 [Xenorhabdus mauleonii]|uniref:Tetratricopeptide repeat-containing protein n=1 Tax=Xenorhabdus mauleonii TaxID=351675 RepID=A0A1I3UP93_9GAMM|nr:porin family protein [Xenorhabdus mauleonii]PHM39645.1 hypothetical protein Xmau_02654 [Xenorhabdus mauleonii]SFJ83796.1 Tetratricopeptide repeat-containing protein [Xenorhabdus mauleonii]
MTSKKITEKKIQGLFIILFAFLCLATAYANENIDDKIWQPVHANQQKNDLKNIAQALYLAINHQQWREVSRLLVLYQKIPEYDPLLVNFAQGGLARFEGNLTLAASYYQKILRQKPQSTRIKLELARVYFEDQKNRKAEQLFDALSKQRPLPETVLQNIHRYQTAIARRRGWHSSLSLGYIYNDNINASSDQSHCLLPIKNMCVEKVAAPKKIKDWGNTYHFTLNRYDQFFGHHGIFGQGSIYGENYLHYHDGNENSLRLAGGYYYKNRTHDLSFGPLFEYNYDLNNQSYYAIGANMKWQWDMSARTALYVELEHKKLKYKQEFHFKNSELSSSYFSLSHAINDKFILFGGGLWVYRNNPSPPERYQKWGVNAGITGQLYPGIIASLLVTLNQSRFGSDATSLLISRQDNEQIYTAYIKFPAAQIVGITPSLTLRHRRNRSNSSNNSNIGWLHNYDKNEVQIRLEKNF